MKDLIDWDQQRLDVEVKYTQVMEQFSVDDAIELLPPPDFEGPVPTLSGDLALNGVTVLDTSGTRLLDSCSFHMDLAEAVAIEGGSTGGGETLVEVVARLATPSSGRVSLGGRDLRDWSYAVTGRRVSFVANDTFFPQSDIADALLSGLRHDAEGPSTTTQRHHIIKGRGNNLDIGADWVDYASAGASGPDDIVPVMTRVLAAVDLESDVVSFGLGRQLTRMEPEVETRFIEARGIFRERLEEAGLTQLVEPFDPDRYNNQASIAENLVFGTPVDGSMNLRVLGSHAKLRKVLASEKLDAELFDMGREIASTILELFEGLQADNPLFEQLSLMSPEQFPDFEAALKRLGTKGYAKAGAGDQAIFLDLAFGYIEARDRLGLLETNRIERLLKARHLFHDLLGDDQREIAFYDPKHYNVAASIKDNILMGRVAFGVAEADARVNEIVQSIIDDFDLRSPVFETGLAFNIGSGGKRLSAVQRQKLALARGLMRRPDFLVAHRPLGQLDGRSQAIILKRVLSMAQGKGGPRFGILWNLENPALAQQFPRVIRLEHGRIVDDRSEAEPADAEHRTMSEVRASA